MAEIKEFVINDRRKFTADGELRPDAQPAAPSSASPANSSDEGTPAPHYAEVTEFPHAASSPAAEARPEPAQSAPEASSAPAEPPAGASDSGIGDEQLPPPPTAEQAAQAARAYAATVDRLDTAIRATNPGMDRMPEMTLERVVQSLYMQALLQLGGGAESGQQPQVDLLGARQTIDMLTIIESKTKGNLSGTEQNLLDSALFEIRMAFLEVTQAIARQAQSRQTGMPGAGFPPGGPSIVR